MRGDGAVNTTLLGRWGERVAADHLRKHGWRILASGYRCRWGEVDLIAEKGGLVSFVEVKLRKSDGFAPAREAVTPAKQRKLRATAEFWLSEHGDERCARFDVVEVYAPDGVKTRRPKVQILEDAFS